METEPLLLHSAQKYKMVMVDEKTQRVMDSESNGGFNLSQTHITFMTFAPQVAIVSMTTNTD